MRIAVVIPARLQSTRLPEKPLIKILGKSIIQRTYEQCCKAVPTDEIFVVTDNNKILNHAKDFCKNAVLTSENCLTGTDRVAEFATMHEADYYANVQGDEPVFNYKDLELIIDELKKDGKYEVINGYSEITNEDDFFSLGVPKVVFNNESELLFASRSPIPLGKVKTFKKAWRQICVYAFSKKSLNEFSKRGMKTSLEEVEDIEILRFIELGMKVKMLKMSNVSIPVDFPEDIIKVEKFLYGKDS